MKKGLMGILAAGLMTSAANAGVLSMRFAGGGTEVTLAPSETVTVEVLFAMGSLDAKTKKVTGIDARFDVGDLGPGNDGTSVVNDGSTKLEVLDVVPAPFANWNDGAATPTPAVFNRSFFAASGDPNGLSGPAGNLTEQAPVVIMSLVLHKVGFGGGDTYIVFHNEDPLPALYNGSVQWTNQFNGGPVIAGQQFTTGQGNMGDGADASTYTGDELLQPLIIHQIPEPGSLALLALGGLAMLRRRK